jgi:hypothetical protein
MKKHLIALAICLAFIAVITGCSAPGSSSPAISRDQALEAFDAAGMTAWEAALISIGGVSWTDTGTSGTHMKRSNVEGTVYIDWNPSDDSYPMTFIITAVNYPESVTGYVVNGTMPANATSSSNSSQAFDLTLSHASKPVRTVTGTLTKTGASGTEASASMGLSTHMRS